MTNNLAENYKLQPNDIFNLDVFTNNGERLLDPNFELSVGAAANQQNAQIRDRFVYIIQEDGTVDLPLIGNQKLSGMTQFEAELELARLYNDIYIDSFVKLRLSNRRVFVLGAPGGMVVPIPNEQTSIYEVLALAQGIQFGAKSNNIKLIRDDDVFVIDLSTVSGMKNSKRIVFPGDVVYIEPWRRPWIEALRDSTPAISLFASIVTLTFLIVDNVGDNSTTQWTCFR